MQIFDAIKSGIVRGLDFSGHSTRPEFWGFVLFLIAGGFAAHYASILSSIPVLAIFLALMIIPYLAVGARRLHAMGKSGWWQLIPINLILMVKLLERYVDFDKPFVEAKDWVVPGILLSLGIVAVIIQLLLITWYSQASTTPDEIASEQSPQQPQQNMHPV